MNKVVKQPTITPTMLEAWDLFQVGVISKEDLIGRLLRVKSPPSLPMRIGIAYHEFIRYRGDSPVSYEGFSLDSPSACLYRLDTIGNGCEHEVPLSRDLGTCTLSGRIDGLDTLGVVHEYKTSENLKTYMDYILSPQWAAYCYLSGAKRAVYHLVRWRIEKKTNLVITVGVSEFDFSAPRGLAEEMYAKATEILTFANNQDITIGA